MQILHERAFYWAVSLKRMDEDSASHMIEQALKDQDRFTRHVCAEAVTIIPDENTPDESVISRDMAHRVCLNVKAI